VGELSDVLDEVADFGGDGRCGLGAIVPGGQGVEVVGNGAPRGPRQVQGGGYLVELLLIGGLQTELAGSLGEGAQDELAGVGR
jgi:hypothetical protein